MPLHLGDFRGALDLRAFQQGPYARVLPAQRREPMARRIAGPLVLARRSVSLLLVVGSLRGLALAQGSVMPPDRDADGIPDASDDCSYYANPGQSDVDQ